MKLRYITIGVVVILIGAGFVLGFGPLDEVAAESGIGSDESSSVTTPESTGTVYTDSGSGSGSGDGSASDGAPFSFAIQQIEKCGQTCRDVTVTLANEQDQQAEDVTVYTSIYVGNSTDKADLIWKGQEDVGTMAAGESVTRTQRVELSIQEAYAVKQADGWITVVTTIDSADTTITFKSHRDVA